MSFDPAVAQILKDLGFYGGAIAVGILFILGVIVSGKKAAQEKLDVTKAADVRLADTKAAYEARLADAADRLTEVKEDRDEWKELAESVMDDRQRLVSLFEDLTKRPLLPPGA